MKAHNDSALPASDNLLMDTLGSFLCGDGATVNFTSAEAKILTALVDAGEAGLCIRDALALFGSGISRGSVNIMRTHISKIRKKVILFGRDRISLEWNRDRRRYFLVSQNLRRNY